MIIPFSLKITTIHVPFIYQNIPFSSLSRPISVVVKFIKADTHRIISEKNDSLDCRVTVLVVKALCFDLVHEFGSFVQVFYFHLPFVGSIWRGPTIDLDSPLGLHKSLD